MKQRVAAFTEESSAISEWKHGLCFKPVRRAGTDVLRGELDSLVGVGRNISVWRQNWGTKSAQKKNKKKKCCSASSVCYFFSETLTRDRHSTCASTQKSIWAPRLYFWVTPTNNTATEEQEKKKWWDKALKLHKLRNEEVGLSRQVWDEIPPVNWSTPESCRL